jgi:hypothetical protein
VALLGPRFLYPRQRQRLRRRPAGRGLPHRSPECGMQRLGTRRAWRRCVALPSLITTNPLACRARAHAAAAPPPPAQVLNSLDKNGILTLPDRRRLPLVKAEFKRAMTQFENQRTHTFGPITPEASLAAEVAGGPEGEPYYHQVQVCWGKAPGLGPPRAAAAIAAPRRRRSRLRPRLPLGGQLSAHLLVRSPTRHLALAARSAPGGHLCAASAGPPPRRQMGWRPAPVWCPNALWGSRRLTRVPQSALLMHCAALRPPAAAVRRRPPPPPPTKIK